MPRYVSAACALALVLPAVFSQDLDPRIKDAEARRLATIAKVQPAVVAVFDIGGQGGGSGVLISADGYALTNYHVVEPCGAVMRCGLADGVLYDAVLVGQDMVGDLALIKLLPKTAGKPFPFAALGDSDLVKVGDWSLAMGNPFLLANDFTPTITFGIVSGTHRYQHPAGLLLEYTDCIQTEASINPGNSGGPLFNLAGEVIGINGRGSFEKRGRVNVGVGYAISANQIKNFLGHLRGGLNVDHATLGARVRTDEEGKMIVDRILESSDAYRRGLREDDEIISFAGQPIRSTNQYKNVLGIYPKGWRLPLVYRHTEEGKANEVREALVRLMGVLPAEQPQPQRPQRPERPRPGEPPIPIPMPGQEKKPKGPPKDNPATKLYEEKEGFANFYFNKLERDRLLAAFKKHGDFAALKGPWKIEAEVVRPIKNKVALEIGDKLVTLKLGEKDFAVEPLKPGETVPNLSEPKDSGGLLVALYQWRRLLLQAEKGFEGGFTYGGHEPLYPDGTAASRALTEVLNTEHSAVAAKWFFGMNDQALQAAEVWIDKENQDPCEIVFGDFRAVEGRKLPFRMAVRFAGREWGEIVVTAYTLGGK
jgi:S1-C subfamily serine protease